MVIVTETFPDLTTDTFVTESCDSVLNRYAKTRRLQSIEVTWAPIHYFTSRDLLSLCAPRAIPLPEGVNIIRERPDHSDPLIAELHRHLKLLRPRAKSRGTPYSSAKVLRLHDLPSIRAFIDDHFGEGQGDRIIALAREQLELIELLSDDLDLE